MAKIMQTLKQAVLQFWRLRVPVTAACILLLAVLCTTKYMGSSRTASAQMTLNYSEASRGLNPNRTRFTSSEMTSDDVLQNTIQNAGLTGQLTTEDLRSFITVSPLDVDGGSTENYITTSYRIDLAMDKSYPHLTAETLLEIYCGSYKDYFMEHYGENQSIFSSTMPDYFDSEPYLRLKSLTVRAQQMDRYLTARVGENKSYTDATTGNTFLSLSKQVQNVLNYEIPRLEAYILRGGLAQDPASLTEMLNYKLQIEQLDYDKQMAYYEADNVGIRLYDETMSAIVMIPTLDENNEFYMSRTKTALDDMATDANGSLTEAASHQDVMTSTRYVVQQMLGGADAGQLQQVNAMLQELSGTLDKLQQGLRVTDASYIIYKTQNYLVFNYDVESFAGRIGLKTALAETLLFAALNFAICTVRTAKRLRKERQN